MSLTKLSFTWEGVETVFYTVGTGDTLIFLPGWGSAFLTYRPFVDILATRFKVIVLELPGFSRVKAPDHQWNFNEYSDYVSAFISMYPGERLLISGHSFGATVAIYTASKNEKVEKLILFDGEGLPVKYDLKKFFTKYLLGFTADLLQPQHLPAIIRMLKVIHQSARNYLYQLRLVSYVISEKVTIEEQVFAKISIPPLIFWGNKDSIFTKEMAEELNRKLQGEKVVYVNGNHNWPIFSPELIRPYVNII